MRPARCRADRLNDLNRRLAKMRSQTLRRYKGLPLTLFFTHDQLGDDGGSLPREVLDKIAWANRRELTDGVDVTIVETTQEGVSILFEAHKRRPQYAPAILS